MCDAATRQKNLVEGDLPLCAEVILQMWESILRLGHGWKTGSEGEEARKLAGTAARYEHVLDEPSHLDEQGLPSRVCQVKSARTPALVLEGR